MKYSDRPENQKSNSRKKALDFYYKNRDRINTDYNAARAANPEFFRQRAKEYRLKRSEKIAGRPQSKNCEVCGIVAFTVFDHDHSTGKFRGWICPQCNHALGQIYDNIEVLKKMIEYLERSKKDNFSLL